MNLIEKFLHDVRLTKQKISHTDINIHSSFKLVILEAPDEFDVSEIKKQIDPSCNFIEIHTKNGEPVSLNIFHKFNNDADIFIKHAVNVLLQKSNDLSLFDLPNLLQMISAERKTLALKIIGSHSLGIVVFKNGKIIYSRVDDVSGGYFGEEALYLILSWFNPVIWVFPYPENIQPNIETDLSFLLMDAMRYIDELKASGKTSEHISLNIKEYLELHNIRDILMISLSDKDKIIDNWFDKKEFGPEQSATINKNILNYFFSGKKLALTFFQEAESFYIDSDNYLIFINVGREFNVFVILRKTDSSNTFLIKMILAKLLREFEL